MKLLLLTLLLFGVILDSSASTKPSDIAETSPDGKWLFKAQWFGDNGYMWELENTSSRQTYFAQASPRADEILPARLRLLWSPDSHYLAINFRYGRIASGMNVIALAGAVPDDHVTWPRSNEISMIKPEDRKMWTGEGVANCGADEWIALDTLVLDIDMNSELNDKTSGTKFHIDSSRQVTIQFSGLKGKVVDDQPPVYDKEPEP